MSFWVGICNFHEASDRSPYATPRAETIINFWLQDVILIIVQIHAQRSPRTESRQPTWIMQLRGFVLLCIRRHGIHVVVKVEILNHFETSIAIMAIVLHTPSTGWKRVPILFRINRRRRRLRAFALFIRADYFEPSASINSAIAETEKTISCRHYCIT